MHLREDGWRIRFRRRWIRCRRASIRLRRGAVCARRAISRSRSGIPCRAGRRAVLHHEHPAQGPWQDRGRGWTLRTGHLPPGASPRGGPQPRCPSEVTGCTKMSTDPLQPKPSPQTVRFVARRSRSGGRGGTPSRIAVKRGLAHVRLEAPAASRLPGCRRSRFHEQLGAGAPIRRPVDPDDGSQRRAPGRPPPARQRGLRSATFPASASCGIGRNPGQPARFYMGGFTRRTMPRPVFDRLN